MGSQLIVNNNNGQQLRQYNLIELLLRFIISMIWCKQIRLLSRKFVSLNRPSSAICNIKPNIRYFSFNSSNLSMKLNNTSCFSFSSFKDEYNEESQEPPAILKEFQQLITRFQSSYGEEKYEEARQCLQKAGEIMKKTNCQKSLQYVEIMLNLVVTNNKLNASDRSIQALLEAETILDQLPQGNYPYKQMVYSNLSDQYQGKKDQQKTIVYLVKLLAVYNKTDIESLQVVAINDKIGSIYIDLGQEEMALPFYKEGLAKIEKIKGQNCVESLRLLDDLSYVFYKLEKYEESLANREKVLKIMLENHGKQSIEYITQLKNIGAIYKKMKNFKKYSECYEQALTITACTHLHQHPITNWVRENLAMSYYSMNEFFKAIPVLETSLKFMSFQKEREKYIFFRKAAAESYKNIKEYEVALSQFQMVIDLLGKDFENSCEYAYILSQIGLMNYNLEKYDISLEKYLKSLEIQEKIHGKASETCIRLYENIAELYYLLGNTEKSQEYLKEIEKHAMNATKSH